MRKALVILILNKDRYHPLVSLQLNINFALPRNTYQPLTMKGGKTQPQCQKYNIFGENCLVSIDIYIDTSGNESDVSYVPSDGSDSDSDSVWEDCDEEEAKIEPADQFQIFFGTVQGLNSLLNDISKVRVICFMFTSD